MAFRQIRRRFSDQSGASLILGVMALLLLGLSLMAGLRYVGPKVDLQRTTGTASGTDPVSAALMVYATKNSNQLPCPDTFGSGQSGTCNNATAPVWGLVPWQTLGLSPQDALDRWGHRRTYALAGSTNPGAAASVCNTSTGDIATWNNLATTAGGANAAYVLLSHGPNGSGAFQQSGATLGKQIAAATTGGEAYNCAQDVTSAVCYSPSRNLYSTGPYQSPSAGGTPFDDIVSPSDGTQFQCLCNNLASGEAGLYLNNDVNQTIDIASGTGVSVYAQISNMHPRCDNSVSFIVTDGNAISANGDYNAAGVPKTAVTLPPNIVTAPAASTAPPPQPYTITTAVGTVGASSKYFTVAAQLDNGQSTAAYQVIINYPCAATTVHWGTGNNCSAAVPQAVYGTSSAVSYAGSSYSGSGTANCSGGQWSVNSATCVASGGGEPAGTSPISLDLTGLYNELTFSGKSGHITGAEPSSGCTSTSDFITDMTCDGVTIQAMSGQRLGYNYDYGYYGIGYGSGRDKEFIDQSQYITLTFGGNTYTSFALTFGTGAGDSKFKVDVAAYALGKQVAGSPVTLTGTTSAGLPYTTSVTGSLPSFDELVITVDGASASAVILAGIQINP